MNLVERHIIMNNKEIDLLCFKSKNLYNYTNYVIKNIFSSLKRLPSEFDIIKAFANYDQPDYRALPAQTSQQIIKQLASSWISFFKLCKTHKELKPKPPKFKHKTKGRNIVIFTNQQVKLKNGYIYFPKMTNIPPLKTKVDNIRQVRIVPQQSCHAIEVVYEKQQQQVELNENLYLSIDLGIDNLATIVTNSDNQHPLLVSGRALKSINQFYNKKKAKLQSELILKHKQYLSNRTKRLDLKRNNKVHDYTHKASRFIVNYAIQNKIANIIIGYNKGWKNEIDIGKKNNQKFVSIPYLKLIQQIQYKSQLVGINVVINEESYTSKCDALSLEPIGKQEQYLGKRFKRGLFQSATNKLINADVNGALNITRKVVDDSVVRQIIDRGLVFRPIKINSFNKILNKKQNINTPIKTN